MKKIFLFLLLLLIPAVNSFTHADKPESEAIRVFSFDAGYGSIEIYHDDQPLPYRISSISTLPNNEVNLRFNGSSQKDVWIVPGSGIIKPHNTHEWVWHAPGKPGVYPVTVTDLTTGNQSIINMFVLTPTSRQKGEYLNGYRIGHYPKQALNNNPAYLPPKGFIEVTRQNMHTKVSPNFTLAQFLCKQEGGFPKYVILSDRLLHQLEYILEQVNELGYKVPTFTVMSGYRTPYYNQRIGNGRYSRHIYGDAADIFIDTNPKNGMMDDLNGDGKIDREDARILFDLIEHIQQSDDNLIEQGGLGLYGKRPWRGPFVHVDSRGHRARWIH